MACIFCGENLGILSGPDNYIFLVPGSGQIIHKHCLDWLKVRYGVKV
jgi:hypothetical protein